MDVVEAAAAPSADVLPTGVRRRLSRRDAWLPLVLTGELLAGMVLGMAWHVAATVPDVRLPPAGSTVATEDGTDRRPGAVVVAPPAAAPAPAPPPRRAEPRNPFAMQVG